MIALIVLILLVALLLGVVAHPAAGLGLFGLLVIVLLFLFVAGYFGRGAP